MSNLFGADDSDSDIGFKINKEYAKKYEVNRRREELQKYEAKYGPVDIASDDSNSSSESSSEDDEDAVQLTEDVEKQFLKTLSCLKSKDPKIYDKDVHFFEPVETENVPKEKKSKEKPMKLRDYERKVIIEKQGKFSDSEDEPEETSKPLTYVEEQRRIKEGFKKIVEASDDEETDFFSVKTKTKEEMNDMEENYKKWLKGEEAKIDESDETELRSLRNIWSNPNLDANEKFLRDYILNKKYLDCNVDDDEEDYCHDVLEDKNISEDENDLKQQEEFEHKYNFRFEEPDQDFIKRYPRTMENSLRKKDTRRSEKRQEVKQRKEKEKIRMREELKQMKALKRKELEEKLDTLKEVAGNGMNFDGFDLEGDFDPEQYDKKMKEVFDANYYQENADEMKPEFPEIDEELGVEKDWDEYDPNVENEEKSGPHCEDENFVMDADYDPSKVKREKESARKRKRGKKGKLGEILAQEKPKFTPENYKSYKEYFDQYYNLDCEDTIDDLQCKFKYREVVPNDYGLTIDEILRADDKELNKWCSLKKALQYKTERLELNEVEVYKNKARNEALKRKILPSLFKTQEVKEEDKEKDENNVIKAESPQPETKSQKRRRKKKTSKIKNSMKEENEVTSVSNKSKKIKEEKIDENEVKIKTEPTSVPRKSKKIKKTKEEKIDENEVKIKTEPTSAPQKSEKIKKIKKKKVDQNVVSENIEVKSEKAKKKKRKMDENDAKSEPVQKKSKPTIDEKVSVKNEDGKQFKKQKNKNRNESQQKKMAKQKRKFENKNLQSEQDKQISSLSDERLKAYGLNPKKFKNKLKYGNKNKNK